MQAGPTYCDIVTDDGGLRLVRRIMLGHVDDCIVQNVGVLPNLYSVDVTCTSHQGWVNMRQLPIAKAHANSVIAASLLATLLILRLQCGLAIMSAGRPDCRWSAAGNKENWQHCKRVSLTWCNMQHSASTYTTCTI